MISEIEKIKLHYSTTTQVTQGNTWHGHNICTVAFPGGDTGALIYWIDGERELTYDEVNKMYAAGYLFNDDQK